MQKSIKELLFLSPLVLLSYLSSYPAFYLVKKGFALQGDLLFSFIAMIGAVLTMIIVPLLVFKNKDKREFGFELPVIEKNTIKLICFPLIIIFILIHLLSLSSEFQKYYTLKQGLNLLFIVEVFISFFYYVAEEFFFRGFLLFYSFERFGFHSIWITNFIFAFLHAGKPGLEILVAFIVGAWLSYVSIKTKSFLPAGIIHFLLALYLNLIINL